MKKIFSFLLIPVLLFSSEKPESGKLPKDFNFRQADEGCTVRISFMQQWQEYESQQVEVKQGETLDITVNRDATVRVEKKDKPSEK